jgi:long-chain acyl-CoA synthetase
MMRGMPLDALHTTTLADVLREHGRSWSGKTALVCGDERYTYAEFDQRASQLANALRDRGVGTGDRILWLGQNCHLVLESLLAAAKLGASFCPANWRQSPDELAYVLDDLAPAAVLWQADEIGEPIVKARESTGSKALWIGCDEAAVSHGDPAYAEILASGDTHDLDIEVDPASPVLIMYTAAFSGRPQAAQLSHLGLTLQNLNIAIIQQVTPDDVYLNCGPLFHIATFMTTAATFQLAGTNVFTKRADAEEICRLTDAEKVTGAFILPQVVKRIVEVNKDRQYDLSSLQTMSMGNKEFAEMISPRVTYWMRKPGGYGQTEVNGLLTFSAFGDGPMAPGRPTPGMQVRIVDEDMNELPVGETGEIVARGPAAMVGYFGKNEENARRQRGDWHHTNDLGRREADGTISFIGPKTELIKTGVENVYPAEVEGALQKHPAVAEVVVIGVPDPVWDQNVKAVVRLQEGQQATAEELIEHAKSLIASYKKPKEVDFVDAFPRLESGFIDRDAVKAAHGGGGTPGRGA